MNKRDLGKYYNEIQKNLEDKVVQADNLLASIQATLEESESNRKLGADTLASINQNLQQAVKLITDTNTDLAQVSALRVTALDPVTGIDAILVKITTVSEKAEKTAEKITQLSQDASNNTEDIKNSLVATKKDKEAISKLAIEAQDLLEKLHVTYQMAVNTGLAGSFDERRKQVEVDFVNKWSKRFAYSLTALAIIAAAIIVITFLLKGFGLSSIVFFRLSLLTPLIFYTGYSAVQYTRERALLEKYAFKAAVAASLESYTELLKIQFGEKYDEKVIGFVLSSMSTIYGEPHEVVKKRIWAVGLKGNRIAEIKAEITDEMQNKVEDLVDKKINDVEK